jgi:hypothetical protein
VIRIAAGRIVARVTCIFSGRQGSLETILQHQAMDEKYLTRDLEPTVSGGASSLPNPALAKLRLVRGYRTI